MRLGGARSVGIRLIAMRMRHVVARSEGECGIASSSLVDEEEERRSSVDGEGERRLQGKIEGGRGRKREARR
jgi:hypothetical protein